MPLDTITTIHKRFSCRAFTDRMPSDADLEAICKAALAAPSAMNRQPWHVSLIKDPALLAELEDVGMKGLAASEHRAIYERITARGGTLFYHAPCMVIVSVNEIDPAGYEQVDCGIITQNIALSATSLGIDNVIVGLIRFAFEDAESLERGTRCGFPEGYGVGLAVLLGYAKEPGGAPHELDRTKITIIE